MNAPNRFLILLTASNFILIGCIALLNSVLGPWGIFLFLGGLFFLPHYQLLDPYRALLSLLLSGFWIDHSFNYTLGFHAFFLGLIFHFAREFFNLGKQDRPKIILYQGFANFVLAFLWFLLADLGSSKSSTWMVSRFLSDFLVSTIFLIPISLWYTKFCDVLLEGVEPNLFRISAHSK